MSVVTPRPPDRAPFLQQLSARGDRLAALMLLALSAALSAAAAAGALRWMVALMAGGASVVLCVAAWRSRGQRVVRLAIAAVLAAQAMLLAPLLSVSPALACLAVLGGLLFYRDARPLWLAAAVSAAGLITQAVIGHAAVAPTAGELLLFAVVSVCLAILAARMREATRMLGDGPRQLAALARDIASGADLQRHSAAAGHAEGSLAAALADTARRVQAQHEGEALAHAENLQIRQALDASRTSMMIADNDHIIRYVNRSVVALLRNQQTTLRQAFPDFDAERLVGSSIHRFHANPERIRTLLNQLQATHNGKVRIGDVHFSQVVTPVFDPHGARVGFAVEWHDRTHELVLENAVADVVDAAARGDLDHRLRSTGGASFLEGLTGGINVLLETIGGTVEEVRQVLSGLAEGDLDRRMHGDHRGAFAAMQRDANTTAEQLGHMVANIQQCAATITTAASEIAAGNASLSTRSERQAAHLQETAVSMEELTTTVRQNASDARQASALADSSRQAAVAGHESMQKVVSSMQAIETASLRIADITGVIDGIAFQTNILALNAAVEAARAGEQGRGFAVVASEVRTLAQRSAAAAQEIKGLITDAGEQVQQGAQQVTEAGQRIDTIVDRFAEVSGLIAGISEASQQQAGGIEQINQTVVEMDQATQQNAALVEEATAAARQLQEQAQMLVQAVAVFRRRPGSSAVPMT